MFEQSMVERTGQRRWGLVLTAATAHAVGLAAVVVGSNWSVAPVPEPLLATPYIIPVRIDQTVAPAPRAAAPPRAPAAPVTAARRQAALAPALVQPRAIPAALPLVPAAPPPLPGGVDPDPAATTDPSGGRDNRTSADAGPGGDGPGDVPRLLTASMTPPEAILRVQPRYTERARIAHLEGLAIVEATIDHEGRVIDVHTIQGLPLGLGEAAVSAVQQWRFRPALLAGRPVAVIFQVRVEFHLR